MPNPIQYNLFINFNGIVDASTVGPLLFYIQHYSRIINTPQGEKKLKEIYLFINSGGGVLEFGNSIYGFIKTFPAGLSITTYNIGAVDSAAIPLFCIGKKRYALPDTRFLIHESTNQVSGELKRIRDTVKCGDKSTEISASIIANVCRKSQKDVEKDIASHKLFNPLEAKEYGLIDDIVVFLPTPRSEDEVIHISK